ncbi:hypothetical protein LPJGGPFB_04481 [Ensifer adhaerens]|uniref:hypothetical protein n=1 Tax=Ensifer adhaerens TaxID=106592 RepID=UPI001567FCB0|nr:hypothetical protein [Ensifer adhaerens]NRP21222.1 hypothetical protein [Ensifer adhaerens]
MKYLAERGQLGFVWGGAALFQTKELALTADSQENMSVNEAFGRTAAALVEEGMVVFLGTRTTAIVVARATTGRKNLTISITGRTIAYGGDRCPAPHQAPGC